MSKRRTFLKQGASALLGIGSLSASAQVTVGKPPVGAAEIGIAEKVRELFQNGDAQQAISLLKEHDVYHKAVHEVKNGSSAGEIGTEDYWGQSQSSVSFAGYKLTGDFYEGSLGYDISGEQIDLYEYAYPKDAIQLSWKPDHFTYESGSLTYSFTLKNPESGIVGDTGITVANEPAIESPGSAIGLKVDDNYTDQSTDGFYGSAAFQATKTESSEGWFAGDYTHTWTTGASSGGITFTAGGPIGIGVKLPTGDADKWELPKNTEEKIVNL